MVGSVGVIGHVLLLRFEADADRRRRPTQQAQRVHRDQDRRAGVRQDRVPQPGGDLSLHHLVPKLKGGARQGTVRLHQICHSAIHARYTEAEIARSLASPELLQSDPELARFVAWVRTKPDDFHAPTRRARDRTAKRR